MATPQSPFDELKHSSKYFNIAQLANLQGRCEDLISVIFVLSGVQSLSLFQNLPFLGPRVMAITSTIFSMQVIPFYFFLFLMLGILALGLQFAFGNEMADYNYFYHSFENTWYVLFGDFGIGFENMQESSLIVAYLVLFVSSLLFTLVMMNIFIAVVTMVYESALESANKKFETNIVDRDMFKSKFQSKSGKLPLYLVTNTYLRPITSKTRKKLKEQAREESKATKQGTLLRLINQGNKEIADHIRKIDEKLNERSA